MAADPRTAYIAYMEDLARRNADIQHVPGTAIHFFLELNYEAILGWEEPDNTGWNMVLMGYETSSDDNRHGRRIEKVACIFDVLKYCKADDAVALQEVYKQARLIGEEVLARMKEHCDDPCNADISTGITVPYNVLLGTKKTIEVGPRWDNYFGYRFSVDVLQDEQVMQHSTPAKWLTI